MIKSVLPGVVGLLSLCLPLAAEQLKESNEELTITQEQLLLSGELKASDALTIYRPDIFSSGGRSILIHGLPALTLLDGRRFLASSALGRMGLSPIDLFPVAMLKSVEVQPINASPMYGTDSPGGVVNLRLDRDYSGGEVGIFYGRSSGKFGREDMQAYMIGGVGNEKFHITVGAEHSESTVHVPRSRPFTAPK